VYTSPFWKVKPMTESCSTCRFFGPPGSVVDWKTMDNVAKAECHRYPPRVSEHERYPLVRAEEWCGEFEAKKGAKS
jgi:hypothetical protein